MFGAGFMAKKREAAKRETAKRAARREAVDRQAAAEGDRAQAIYEEETQDLLVALRSLGLKRDEAIRAAEATRTDMHARLEDRIRAALAFLGNRSAQSRKATAVRPATVT